MTPAQLRLRDWIAAAAGVDARAITADTKLIKERILTSLMILDLILFIEELRGAPLAPASITPAAFQTIAAITATFLAEPGLAEVPHG
jgi:acyl carrier protein